MSNQKLTESEIEHQIEQDEIEDSYWQDDDIIDELIELDDDEIMLDFQPCNDCDLPDACADFGCAIKCGIKRQEQF